MVAVIDILRIRFAGVYTAAIAAIETNKRMTPKEVIGNCHTADGKCPAIRKSYSSLLSGKPTAQPTTHPKTAYLANIENQGAIPSLPVMIQLIKVCGLPVERYFNPEIMREESEQRQRVSHKLKLCPEEYLPIIEGAIDGALKMEQTAKQKEDA